MGQSTNGQICYGIMFEEDTEFPWDDVGEEDWWLNVKGFRHSFQLFDASGNYLNGVEPTEEQSDIYWGERSKFLEDNPLPVSLVNYCSGECPMWIIAVPDTVRYNYRGYPKAFNPSDLTVADQSVAALLDFCKQYDIPIDSEPAWYLSSYWG